MKYIVLKIKIGTTIEKELPFIFPDMLNHDQFAESVIQELRMNHEKDSEVVSAGFCNFFNGDPHCEGRSETLNIDSRPEDNRLISMFNYEHGVVM